MLVTGSEQAVAAHPHVRDAPETTRDIVQHTLAPLACAGMDPCIW